MLEKNKSASNARERVARNGTHRRVVNEANYRQRKMLITGKAVKERLKTGRPLPSFFACLGRSDLRVRLRRQREFERTKERSKRREKIKVPGSEWSIIPLYELYRGDDHSFFSVKVIFTTTPESLPEKLRVLEIGKQRAVSDSDFAESELSIISVPGDQQRRREERGNGKNEGWRRDWRERI